MTVFSITKAELIIKAVAAPDTSFYQITVSRWFEEKRHILLALFTRCIRNLSSHTVHFPWKTNLRFPL